MAHAKSSDPATPPKFGTCTGTNDLSNKNSCPEDLIKDLDSVLTDLTHFSNVQHVFICKIPPRLDFHNINNKVSEFNSQCYQNVSVILRNIFP